MNSENKNLSSAPYRPKHSSLTNFIRRRWTRNPQNLLTILETCDVVPYFGVLPPELRERVPKEMLGRVTYDFHTCLENFLMSKADEIRNRSHKLVYRVKTISQLFGTKCIIKAGGINVYGIHKWEGKFGVACKMSFPEINAVYALKLFKPINPADDNRGHGSQYEIPSAFAAAHAEPKDNVCVYMASLLYENYILTRWDGEYSDGKIRTNKNEIFVSETHEAEPRNYRNGRRIDFGATHRTAYGAAPYGIRKLYRCMLRAARTYNYPLFREIVSHANPHHAQRAMELADDNNNYRLMYEIMTELGLSKTY